MSLSVEDVIFAHFATLEDTTFELNHTFVELVGKQRRRTTLRLEKEKGWIGLLIDPSCSILSSDAHHNDGHSAAPIKSFDEHRSLVPMMENLSGGGSKNHTTCCGNHDKNSGSIAITSGRIDNSCGKRESSAD